MTKPTDPRLDLCEFRPDDAWQHVVIAAPEKCCSCREKNCLRVCPSAVFQWDNVPDHPVLVYYRQCVECGACRLACAAGAIEFAYPHGGYGVVYHHG